MKPICKHRTRLGRWICASLAPCPVEIHRAHEELKASLRASVKAERELLYDLIDNGHEHEADDLLLAHYARTGGTRHGAIVRAARDIQSSKTPAARAILLASQRPASAGSGSRADRASSEGEQYRPPTPRRVVDG